MILARPVDVEVDVLVALVPVLVRMEAAAEERPEPPQAQNDHRRAHQPLAPAGDRFEMDDLPQPEGEGGHDQHAGRMSQPPAEADGPGPATGPQRERRKGGQVVGPREHVEQAGEQAGDAGGRHERRSYLPGRLPPNVLRQRRDIPL